MPNIPRGSSHRPTKPLDSKGQAPGFVLLEVLVAMTLITTSSISLGHTYQKLVLSMGQVREKRVQTHQELDQHEITQAEATKITSREHLSKRIALNESAGVSRRIRPMPHLGGTLIEK